MATQLFKKIADIIKSDFKSSFQGGNITLQDSTCTPVKINKRGPFLCLELDVAIKVADIFPLFPAIEDLRCVADRIIIYPHKDRLFIFIVELKTTNTTGALEQVRASFELSKYICNTAKRLLKYPNTDVQYRGLIFSSKAYKVKDYRTDKSSGLCYQYLQCGQIDLDKLSR